MNFRKFIFYLNDRIKGGVISKHLKDIDCILKDPFGVDSQNKIEIRKDKLIQHALKNVVFYKNNVLELTANKLESFPVINKNIIRDNLKDFISDGYNINKLNKVVTSGSTGTPFGVYHDRVKKNRNSADTIHFGTLAGYTIGTQLSYLKVWTKVNRKGAIKAWLENILTIDVTQLSDNEIRKLVLLFKSKKNNKAFLGYSSALESICRYLDKNEPNTRINNVSAIIAMSEGISENSKNSLKHYFGTQPVSRYSNVENGILAQQSIDGSDEFRINWASYHIEILEINNNQSVPNGKPGRIVITDLFNYAMPMIRYDTGDIGILDYSNDRKKVVLKNVEGRKMDMVFDTNGDLVSSFTITNNMWLYPEIRQYQFLQLDKSDYLFKLNLSGKFEREALLISEFKTYFGLDASIKVEYVDEIPLLNSGKRKKVINLSI
jgi:phenylacetate-CoA ligase